MFDDLIIHKKESVICVVDVVERIRELTAVHITTLGSLSSMASQPDKGLQIDILNKAVSDSVDVLDVVKSTSFYITPIPNSPVATKFMWPYGSSILTVKDFKSQDCVLPLGKYRALFIYSWMKFMNGQHLLKYSECLNKVYAAEPSVYTMKKK